MNWKFNHSNLGYLKSNDIINLSVKKMDLFSNYDKDEFLRSHDAQFTIGSDSFQEVVCHDESLGRNDEVSNLFIWFIFV